MDARTKAQEMLDKIAAGKTVFTKAGDTWMIVGPTADMIPGEYVTVTKGDGTTKKVVVGRLGLTRTVQGISYTVAEIGQAPSESAARPARSGYKTVGEGRVYHAQPGATQYDDDGSGRYMTQIWDNS